jgi:hypothetical protein
MMRPTPIIITLNIAFYIYLRVNAIGYSGDHGNEPPASIKDREFLD